MSIFIIIVPGSDEVQTAFKIKDLVEQVKVLIISLWFLSVLIIDKKNYKPSALQLVKCHQNKGVGGN